MNRKQFKNLLSHLPMSLPRVNAVLEDQEILMIDFMDGEHVSKIEENIGENKESDPFVLFGDLGEEIGTRSLDNITRNKLAS